MGDFSNAFEIGRAAAAKERVLIQRIKNKRKQLKKTKEHQAKLLNAIDSDERILLMVKQIDELWKQVDKDDEKCIEYLQKISRLDKLIKKYEDSDATDSEKEEMYDGDETDDDLIEVENPLQYIKLKL